MTQTPISVLENRLSNLKNSVKRNEEWTQASLKEINSYQNQINEDKVEIEKVQAAIEVLKAAESREGFNTNDGLFRINSDGSAVIHGTLNVTDARHVGETIVEAVKKHSGRD